jgi:hypothetical protein
VKFCLYCPVDFGAIAIDAKGGAGAHRKPEDGFRKIAFMGPADLPAAQIQSVNDLGSARDQRYDSKHPLIIV